MTSSMSARTCSSTTSRKFWSPRGTRRTLREVPTATGAPPRKAPTAASAETAAEVSSVTRAVSSPGVIELPFRTLDRSKEIHESRGDAEPEAQQQQPGLGAEPPVRVVAGDEPDDRCHHEGDPDRGHFAERFPGAPLPGRRHVKKDTSTSNRLGQPIVNILFK